ncbi:hypothetical protein [Rubellimicrobium roseum]|uniref:Uncharacterized protein n=1 Tax=Rubellimicrobium roseum TaxID=687525 RepID=A0A5C4N6K4_9RHOB|nr:hypothetical protein [Rubellimicrobium roseum]TNC66556.1 hypothetical protein FHG71_16340 [Rubellimicrobium roseum]
MQVPDPKIPKAWPALKEVRKDTLPKEVRRATREATKTTYKKSQKLAASGKAADKKQASWFVLRHVSLLGWVLLQLDQVAALRRLFPEEPRRRRGIPSLVENPFYWLLLHTLSLGDNKTSEGILLRNANLLLYAHRHSIPPYLVVEFIKGIKDAKRINEKVANGEYEPWHPLHKRPESVSGTTTKAKASSTKPQSAFDKILARDWKAQLVDDSPGEKADDSDDDQDSDRIE